MCVGGRVGRRVSVTQPTRRRANREREKFRSGDTVQFTNDEDASAGSDARDHVGGDTLPFSVILLAEGQELQAAAGEDVVLTLAWLPHLRETKAQLGGKSQKKARCCD